MFNLRPHSEGKLVTASHACSSASFAVNRSDGVHRRPAVIHTPSTTRPVHVSVQIVQPPPTTIDYRTATALLSVELLLLLSDNASGPRASRHPRVVSQDSGGLPSLEITDPNATSTPSSRAYENISPVTISNRTQPTPHISNGVSYRSQLPFPISPSGGR